MKVGWEEHLNRLDQQVSARIAETVKLARRDLMVRHYVLRWAPIDYRIEVEGQ